jgi:hypothetical protein
MKKLSQHIFIFIFAILFLIPLSFYFTDLKNNIVESAGTCTIISAQWNPSGQQADTFYAIGTTTANILVKTKDCVGQNLLLSIAESDYAGDDYWNNSGIYERSITVPTDNFTSKIELGEEDCENSGSIDCELYIELSSDTQKYNSYNQSRGVLFYECSGICEDEGAYLETIANGTDAVPIDLDKQTPINEPNNLYKLLAPIPGMTEAPENIGDYFNKIFLLAIGLCGALAVIMIVIGGVQYMGNDSIFGKTEAKSRILASVLGLLIALGSYALLNTINPDLLGGGGVNIAQVKADITEAEIVTQESPAIYNVAVGKCPAPGIEPVVDITNGVVLMNVCGTDLANKVRLLIQSAKTAGITLTGNAFRDPAEQIRLREINGCSPIMTGPVSSCKVPTAIPGTSLHESGMAIDFKCNGLGFINIKKRPETQECFNWLKIHAIEAGLSNMPSENWHWSTTGL